MRFAAISPNGEPRASYAAAAFSLSYSTRRSSNARPPCHSAYAAPTSPSSGIPTLPGLTRYVPSGPSRWNWMWLCPKTMVRLWTPASRSRSSGPGSLAKLSSSRSGQPWTYRTPSSSACCLQRVEPTLVVAEAGLVVLELARDVRPVPRQLPEPAFAVAADPGGVRKGVEELDRLLRPRRPRGVIAAQKPAVGTGLTRVREDGLEGGHVPVNVVERCQHRL